MDSKKLPWWPSFFKRLKACVYFLRDKGLLTTLLRSLRSAGRTALAMVLAKLSLPSCANWRWFTVTEICRALSAIIESLAAFFDPRPFQQARDEVMNWVRDMVAAFTLPSWLRQFNFISWFSNWIGEIQEWINLCTCPHHQGRGLMVDCWHKGRRLAGAYEYGMSALGSGLRAANHWSQTGEYPADLLPQVQGCVRFCFALGKAKLQVRRIQLEESRTCFR